MKRSRAEAEPSPKPAGEHPSKAARRPKDPAAKAQARAEAEKLWGEAGLAAPADGVEAWDLAGEAGGCWWWWGVEEEVLLGWFPFVDEDFVFTSSESRGAGGGGVGGAGAAAAFWEDFHDIWQLQHIHEVPTSSVKD